MPRSTAFLIDEMAASLAEATGIVQAAEGSSVFVYSRRLYVYEAAYLLAFSAWENFLEQSFLRFMCGYASSSGAPTATTTWGKPSNLTGAMTTLLGGKPFKLWHNPQHVVGRSQGFFVGGAHELVVASALADIEDFAAIRHYVAHRSADTEVKFQASARRLTGAGIVGGRAGRLLRSSTIDPVSGDHMTWMDRICLDLRRYALQIAG
ncbi:hypothetical protein ACSFA0_14590 [Variovorax sp. LT1P1]